MNLFNEESSSSQASSAKPGAAGVSAPAIPGPGSSSSTPPVQRHPVTIVGYNARWPLLFTAEKQRVMTALQKAGISARIKAVEHIGSTSVPGLFAKPVVDLMIGVQAQTDLNTFPVTAFTALGYVHRPFSASSPPITNPPRLLFSNYLAPATNVHVFVYGGSRWNGHLAVRNYLRAHPKMAAIYGRLKQVFAAQHSNDIVAYGTAKRPFLDSLESLALRGTGPGGTGGSGGSGSTGGSGGSGSTGGSTSQGPVYLGDSDGWKAGTWYVQDAPDGWFVSPYQNMKDPVPPGIYACYDGNNGWQIVGFGDNSQVEDVPQNDIDFASDPGPAIITMTREDGSQYTSVLLDSTDANFNPPPNAVAIVLNNGDTMLLWNNDGSRWTGSVDPNDYPFNGTSDGSGSRGDGSGDDG